MNTNTFITISQTAIASLALLALTTAPSRLQAATITVTSAADSGPGTLRAALASAVNGDTIDFSLATPARIILTNGELLVSKSVNIIGPGVSNLTVDGNAASGVFHIGSNSTATISGLTITNGYVTYPGGGGGIHNDHATLSISNCVLSGNVATVGSCGGGRGGAIYNNHGTLTVRDCTLSGNATGSGGCGQGRGGAIFNDGLAGNAKVLLVNTIVSNNVGEVASAIQNTASEGGVANVDIVHSILIGNSPFGGFGGRAIDNYGFQGLASVRILDSTVSGHLGGGILNYVGTLSISNSTLSANSTSTGLSSGGTILNLAVSGLTSAVEIANSTLSDNSAYYGGAIANYVYFGGGSAILRILNSTLSGNTAAEGGGINNQGNSFVDTNAIVEILNCTFSGNTGGFGSDCIYNHFGIVALGSTILSATASIDADSSYPGKILSLGYNLSSDDGGGFLTNATDQINTNPLLGPLQDNGGPTLTHAFVSCSPAIDRGKNFTGSAADQRGLPRSIDDPARPSASGGDGTDIGAFEAQAHVPDITPPNLACPADIFANETPGAGTRLVSFAPVVHDNCDPSPSVSCTPISGSTFSLGTTTVTCRAADALGNSNQCSFTVTVCPIIITVTTTEDSGPGSLRQAILDANSCAGKNIIEFASSAYGTILLTSGELLITDELCINGPGITRVAVDGNASSRVFHLAPSNIVTVAGLTITNGFGDYGGGMLNEGSKVSINNCTVSGNFANQGGGIANFGAVEIGNSTLKENSAYGGGGFWNANGSLSISNSALISNEGIDFDFATAIYNQCWDGIDATLTIINSTLSGNPGIAIYNQANTFSTAGVQIFNSTVAGSSFNGGDGGVVYNFCDGISTARVEVACTILKAGTSDQNIYNDSGIVISLGFNLSSDDGGGALTKATDQINTDPLLGPLQDNGGPTFTHALLCGSPAIDKGKNISGAATDQRGLPRTFDRPQNPNAPGGEGSDIGAFETQQFCTPFLNHFGITSNRFGFNINAESNQLVTVQATTNLTAWIALATNAIGGAPLRFNDTNPPSLPRRFYRARTQ